MALTFESIKKDFARNKKRSMILGALSLALVGFVVKAYLELAPRSAAADSNLAATPVQENSDTLSAAETDARIKQSKDLWSKLREQRGVLPTVAFTFAPTYYNQDPTKVRETNSTQIVVAPQPEPVNPQSEEDKKQKQLVDSVNKRKAGLILNSVVVGNGNSRPVAVISSPRLRGKIMGIGDEIDGFKIIAIKARAVDFTMEGVTVSVWMANTTQPAGQ